MRTRRSGYTLTEVMVTIAIMAIIAAISVPIGESMYLSVRLDAAGDSVRSSWADGQSHSMNEARPYRFAYIPGTGNYRLAPDSDSFWTGSGNTQTTDSTDPTVDPPVVLSGQLPHGVFFRPQVPRRRPLQ